MTVQALADRCAGLGVTLGRVTITKLEGGRRQAVTPAELAVLAAALAVAPAELLYPIGSGERAEILPGRELDPMDAVRWFTGDAVLELTDSVTTVRDPRAGEQSGVLLLRYHQAIADEWFRQQTAAVEADEAAARGDGARETADYLFAAAERYRKHAEEMLSWIRADLRWRGMCLPPIPPGLTLDPAHTANRPGEDGT